MAKRAHRQRDLHVVKEEPEWHWPKPYRSKDEARSYAAGRMSQTYREAGLVVEAIELLARHRAQQYADGNRSTLAAISECEALSTRYREAQRALSDLQGSLDPVSRHQWRKWSDLSPAEKERVLKEIGSATAPAALESDGGEQR